MSLRALRLAALGIPAAALLAACEGDVFIPAQGQCPDISSTVTIRNEAGAEATIFGPGDTVTVQVVLANESTEPVTVALGESCNPTYVEVRDAGGTAVWRGACPPGHLCSCVSDTKTFAPGESVTIADNWDQRVSGDPAPGGLYTGHAVDASECAPQLDDSRPFTLFR